MAKSKQKPHDLRDDMYKPRTTVTDTDDRMAGAKPPSVDPEKGNFRLVTPEPGKNLPEGQTTKG